MAGLTDVRIQRAKPKETAYKLKDERGLYLLVSPAGGRLWRLRFSLHGKESMVSLGSYPEVSLKDAREKREEARRLISKGINPAVHRKVERTARSNTFQALAEEWLELQKAKF